MTVIFKICSTLEWAEAKKNGLYQGSAVDQVDGFIHLSTSRQVEATAARHFAGQDNLVLIAVDAEALGAMLKWEPSRRGDLFPHIYGALPLDAVRWVMPLSLAGGLHVFPDLAE